MWIKIVNLWCGWTHGGGHVKRDAQGRINWQCAKCGRWSIPVSLEDEEQLRIANMQRVQLPEDHNHTTERFPRVHSGAFPQVSHREERLSDKMADAAIFGLLVGVICFLLLENWK